MPRLLSAFSRPRVRAAAAFLLAALLGASAYGATADGWERRSDAAFCHAFGSEPGATDITQDAAGFLWIATQSGLQRWDGYHVRRYTGDLAASGALPDSYLLSLLSDSRGRLWVGTNAAGLVRYDAAHDRFEPALGPGQSLTSDSVYAMAEDGRGGLWIGTGGGLDWLDIDRGSVQASNASALARSLPGGAVRALLRGPEGTLWAGTDRGLYRRDPGAARFVPVALPTSEHDTPIVRRLASDGSGRIWVGTHVHGVFIARPGESTAQPLRSLLATKEGTGTETVTGLAASDAGEMWIGFSGEGILRVDTEHWLATRVRHQEHGGGSLADDDVGALYRDTRGLVWAATDTSVSFHATRSRGIATWFAGGQAQAISHPNVASLLAQPDGRVWLGLGDGGLDIVDPERGNVSKLRRDPSAPRSALPNGRVLSMVPAPDGGVYMGTQRGLYRADSNGAHLRRVEVPGRPATASTWTMAWQGRRLWLGGVDGLWGVEADADDRLRVMAREDGTRLGDRRLTALLPTPDGALWVGTWAGVARLEPATMRVSRPAKEAPGQVGVPAGYASALVRDGAGRLWVGIMGAGIRLLEWPSGAQEPVVRRVTTREGLPHDGVNALVLDSHGVVWVSTDDGLARIAPDTLAVQTYGAAQGVGIRTYWTGSGALTPDGRVLFGGSGGLTIVDPAEPAASAGALGPVVTEVRVGDAAPLHSFPLGPEAPALVVPPGRRSLLVEFAALDFVAPLARRYQFRMTGVDNAWVDVDAGRRIASYTNLPPGGHVLELRTAAAGGAWSPPARLSVTVVPRWHEMPWVRGLFMLAIAGLLAGTVRARLALLRRRHRVLEGLVAERTLQLEESQKQLEQLAYFDGLSGLANRRLFNTELRSHFAHLARRRMSFALLLIDLDHFKQVNDTMGHDAGDAVLVAVARRLGEAVRETDRVARLGGDEFAVLMPDLVDTAAIVAVCARIQESVSRPIQHAQRLLQVDVSIGIACAPRDALTPDALYKAADLALYEAKAAGRGCWRLASAGQGNAQGVPDSPDSPDSRCFSPALRPGD